MVITKKIDNKVLGIEDFEAVLSLESIGGELVETEEGGEIKVSMDAVEEKILYVTQLSNNRRIGLFKVDEYTLMKCDLEDGN